MKKYIEKKEIFPDKPITKIGDKLMLFPETLTSTDEQGRKKALLGKVVYIHPKRRYFTAEFMFFGVGIHESFFFFDVDGAA